MRLLYNIVLIGFWDSSLVCFDCQHLGFGFFLGFVVKLVTTYYVRKVFSVNIIFAVY